jgi:hypothetical protein
MCFKLSVKYPTRVPSTYLRTNVGSHPLGTGRRRLLGSFIQPTDERLHIHCGARRLLIRLCLIITIIIVISFGILRGLGIIILPILFVLDLLSKNWNVAAKVIVARRGAVTGLVNRLDLNNKPVPQVVVRSLPEAFPAFCRTSCTCPIQQGSFQGLCP